LQAGRNDSADTAEADDRDRGACSVR